MCFNHYTTADSSESLLITIHTTRSFLAYLSINIRVWSKEGPIYYNIADNYDQSMGRDQQQQKHDCLDGTKMSCYDFCHNESTMYNIIVLYVAYCSKSQ